MNERLGRGLPSSAICFVQYTGHLSLSPWNVPALPPQTSIIPLHHSYVDSWYIKLSSLAGPAGPDLALTWPWCSAEPHVVSIAVMPNSDAQWQARMLLPPMLLLPMLLPPMLLPPCSYSSYICIYI